MTQREKRDMQRLIERTAAQFGVTVDDVRREIHATIDAAWDNPIGREKREQLFPDGKPGIEEFLFKVSLEVERQQHTPSSSLS